jgi:hypothetical protein
LDERTEGMSEDTEVKVAKWVRADINYRYATLRYDGEEWTARLGIADSNDTWEGTGPTTESALFDAYLYATAGVDA